MIRNSFCCFFLYFFPSFFTRQKKSIDIFIGKKKLPIKCPSANTSIRRYWADTSPLL